MVELANGFVVDRVRRELRDSAGWGVALAPQPFAVLMHLAEHCLIGKDALMQAAWPLIRRALADDAQRIVQTESRRGYRLVAAAQARPAEPDKLEKQRIAFTTSFDGTRIAYATAGQGLPLVWSANVINHLEYLPDVRDAQPP